MLQRVMARSSPGSAEAAGSRLQRGPPAMQWLYSFIDKTAPRQEVINYERDAAPICSRPPRRGPLSDRFCCKTILGARAGNIDSRTATKAQHRFNKSFAPIRLLRVSRLLPSFATVSCRKRPSLRRRNRSQMCHKPTGGLYSISLSARSNRLAGIVWFIDLAVLRLIDSLNVLGCSIGKSAGLVPRRTLATILAR